MSVLSLDMACSLLGAGGFLWAKAKTLIPFVICGRVGVVFGNTMKPQIRTKPRLLHGLTLCRWIRRDFAWRADRLDFLLLLRAVFHGPIEALCTLHFFSGCTGNIDSRRTLEFQARGLVLEAASTSRADKRFDFSTGIARASPGLHLSLC